MPMRVMDVRHMGMCMHHGHMHMPVAVRAHRGGFVDMGMVPVVMAVSMLVFHGFMRVLVAV